jgi:hypothetical protein
MLYFPIHKCLRNVLANLSLHCGNADYNDEANFAKVRAEIADIVRMLRDHAQNEEEFIHPLYRRIGLPFEELEGKHREFDDRLAEIQRLLEEIAARPVDSPERPQLGTAMYRAVNLFLSFYYAHLDEEEYRFLPLLIERMPHDQIIEARGRLQASVRCEDLLLYWKYQVATLNPSERVHVLKEYCRVQPDAYGELCRIAETALPSSEWAHLKARV